MTERHSADNWAADFVERRLHPLAVTVMPLFHVVLIVALLFRAFSVDLLVGARSLAATLLPLTILTYLYLNRTEKDASLHKPDTTTARRLRFAMGTAVGIALLALLEILAPVGPKIPIREVLVSSSLSALIFSDTILESGRSKPYYFGDMIGSLLYFVFFNFPKI
jgi:hypothetical protein